MQTKILPCIVVFIVAVILSFVPYNIYVEEVKQDSLWTSVWRRGIGLPFGFSHGTRPAPPTYPPPLPIRTLWLDLFTFPILYIADETPSTLLGVRVIVIVLNTITLEAIVYVLLKLTHKF